MASPADRHRHRGLRLAAVAVLLLGGGCREPAKPTDEAIASPSVVATKPQLEVGVSGCAGLVEEPQQGRLCLLRPTKQAKPLYLWLHGASDPKVELRFSGVAVEAKRTVDVDGVMLSVELPEQQGRLELSTDEGVWALELRPVSERFEALRKDVQATWDRGDHAAALRRFESGSSELGGAEAAMLACAVGKVVLAGGDYDRVLKITEQVSGSSVVGCVGKASLLAAYIHIYLRPDFNAAELSLRAAEAVQGLDFDARIGSAYLRGVLEHWLGNIDESLLAFQRASRLAWVAGDAKQHAAAMVMQAAALARLGRFEEAEALAGEAEQRTKALHPTLSSDIRSIVGWITVLRREDDPSVPDPSAALRSAIAVYVERGEERNVASLRLDLALALVQADELEAAEAEIGAIDRDALSPDLLVWLEITAARIDLLRKRFAAAEGHLDRARLLADLNQDRELEWRVMLTGGELERARGQLADAVEQFGAASRIADELALSVAGDAGRSLFVTSHSRADFGMIELLLARGDVEEAMCTAIATRARHLRGLWARLRPPLPADVEQRYRELLSRHLQRKQEISTRLDRSWELSTTELQTLQERLGAAGERADKLLAEATALLEDGAPSWSCELAMPERPNDAVITTVPNYDQDSWTAMLARRNGDGELVIETAGVDVVDFEAAGESILEQFSQSLARVASLRVIPMGGFAEVDFHSLWFERGPTDIAITYSLGLGAMRENAPLDFRAAVIAGATNLVAVRREAAAVTKWLQSFGWRVESRWNPTDEPQPSLMHYAGHGFDNGGMLGWQNAIELPDLGRVSAAQIIAGQRSPNLVVLGACSTGGVTTNAIDGGMSLAAAFLLAGASMVIAPTRDVDDTAAYELGRELYRDFSGEPYALARVLARLQMQQLEQVPATDGAQSYSSWRAWVP